MELIVAACRTLASRPRLRLLRALHVRPGQNVSALAAATGQHPDAVSNQLKLLCNYRFARATPSGRHVFYRPATAEATTNPFLRGLRELVDEALDVKNLIRTPLKVCESELTAWDEVFEALVKLFTTYTHLRRLLLLRQLARQGVGTAGELAERIGMSLAAAYRHLDKLQRRGVVHGDGLDPVQWRVVACKGAACQQKLLALVLREFKAHRIGID